MVGLSQVFSPKLCEMQSDLYTKYLLWLTVERTYESRIRKWWGKKSSEIWSWRNEDNSYEWKTSYKRPHSTTCLSSFVSLESFRLCWNTTFSHSFLSTKLSSSSVAFPLTLIFVFELKLDIRGEIFGFPTPLPPWSLLYLCKCFVLLMHICQRNAGLGSRQSHFPLPSWDIPDLNSISLHS